MGPGAHGVRQKILARSAHELIAISHFQNDGAPPFSVVVH